MKKFGLLLFFVSMIVNAFCQTTEISAEGTIDIDCDNEILFLTDSDEMGNYSPGENFTITFCPDGGNSVFFSTTPEDGGFFDLAPGDQLFIYDGVDISAPLIGVYDSSNNATGMSVSSTIQNNDSGCLTFNFISSAVSITATGWNGEITCGILPLPFDVSISSNPEDIDGYIDICKGVEVTFDANTSFPYSGQGYDQENATSYFVWEIADGTTYEGLGLTQISHTFNESFGYLVDVKVNDVNGLITEQAEIKVRVSTVPDWSNILAQYQDTICLENTSTLIAGITPDTTQSFGVVPTESSFIGGGFFGELLELPDSAFVFPGMDIPIYETPIEIDDFVMGQVIENTDDILAVCVTMEHTWVGDLEMWLECPDGTQVVLFDMYVMQSASPGYWPGGFVGGGTNLGEPGGAEPGVGYTYCFTEANPEFGSFADEYGNVVGTFPPGDYLPMGNFDDFLGCEINGEWTLMGADHWGGDDGWIFDWSIIFNPLIDPSAENYTPQLVDVWWDNDPSIIQNNDTIIVVQPDSPGNYNYTVNVLDNFGCTYDTTITLNVRPEPQLTTYEPACYLESMVDVSNVYTAGFWEYEAPNDSSFAAVVPTANGDHIDVNVNYPGPYIFTYTDFFCNRTYTEDLFFVPPPIAELPDSIEICLGEEFFYTLTEQPNGVDISHVFTFPDGGQFGSSEVLADQTGNYFLLVNSNTCPDDAAFAESFFELITCEITTYNVFTPNDDGSNDVFYIQGIDRHPGALLEVYNRWGNVVYEEIDYRNDWEMTDLSEGTYYFVLVLENGEKHTGDFTVLRN